MDSEIIIYGLAILIGLIGMIAKNRKKARENYDNLPPHIPPSFPWTQEEEEYAEPEPATFAPNPAPAPRYNTETPPPYKSESSLQEMMAAEGGRTTTNPDNARGKQSSIYAKSQIKHLEEEQSAVAHELLQDFDMRRAVVYSEVLKPKFEEF